MSNEDVIQRVCPFVPNTNQIRATYPNDQGEGIHYIMWSGGCDSPLLLYEALEIYGSDRVVAISYKYPWLDENKYQTEKLHRESFKANMKLCGEKFGNIRHMELTISETICSGNRAFTNNSGLPQAVAWMLGVPMYATENSYIYSGAIRSDDLSLHLEGYHEMFRGISKTLDKKIYLREPYLYLTKSQVIDKLLQYGLYESTWFCEIPKDIGTPCYECNPCRTHIAALTELVISSSSELVTLQAKKILDKITKVKIDNKTVNSEEKQIRYISDNITEG